MPYPWHTSWQRTRTNLQKAGRVNNPLRLLCAIRVLCGFKEVTAKKEAKYAKEMQRIILLLLFPIQLYPQLSKSIAPAFQTAEKIAGRPEYLNSPYTTAGDKLYMIGHQHGDFPDLGWHVTGEMGGIWHHPIKLLDGFEATVIINDMRFKLDKADVFENFPFGNKHIYNNFSKDLSIERIAIRTRRKKRRVCRVCIEKQNRQDAVGTFRC